MKKLIILMVMTCLIPTPYAEAEVLHGIGLEFAPFTYFKDGEPVGLSIELFNAMLQERKGIEAKFDIYPMKRALKMVADEKNSFKLTLTRTPKRETSFKWVGPTFPRVIALFKLRSRSDLQISSVYDVRDYQVGCGMGYAAVNDLIKAGVPKAHIHENDDDRASIRMLFKKRIDFVANNNLAMAHLLRQEGYSFQDVEQSLILQDKYQYYYAFNKDTDDKIIRDLQQLLDILKQDGTHEKLMQIYLK